MREEFRVEEVDEDVEGFYVEGVALRESWDERGDDRFQKGTVACMSW
jgi:hypothetical protein